MYTIDELQENAHLTNAELKQVLKEVKYQMSATGKNSVVIHLEPYGDIVFTTGIKPLRIVNIADINNMCLTNGASIAYIENEEIKICKCFEEPLLAVEEIDRTQKAQEAILENKENNYRHD